MNFLNTKSGLKIVPFALLCCLAFSGQGQEKEQKGLTYKDVQQIRKYKSDANKSSLDAKSVQKPPRRPTSLNPALSMGGDQGNIQVWQAYNEALGKYMASRSKTFQTPNYYKEKEQPDATTNDVKAEKISLPATKNGQGSTSTIIKGSLGSGLDFNNPVEITTEENNNWFGGATTLPTVEGDDNAITVSSALEAYEINGELSGDIDLFNYTFPANQRVAVEVKPDVTNTEGEVSLFVIDEDGNTIDAIFADDVTEPLLYISPKFSEDRNLVLLVIELQTLSTIFSELEPEDPNYIYGLHPTISYELSVTNIATQTDSYEMTLKKGEVFGLASTNNIILNNTLLKPNGEVGIATDDYLIDASIEKPLPSEGNSAFEYIIPEDGTYTLILEGFGDYATEFATAKPRLDGQGTQYIYLDFTGVEDFTLREFDNMSEEDYPTEDFPELDIIRTLSPMRAFLENWDIGNTKMNTIELAKKITDVTKENLEINLRASGINPDFNVKILSDYGIERLGDRLPNILNSAGIEYSRVVIGGSQEESGFFTIGIANAIDLGNYSADDDALVLLDELSVEKGAVFVFPDGTVFPIDRFSLNRVEFGGNATKMDLVATAVGNLVSHEAGHYLGNSHTDSQNDIFSIMDEGAVGVFGIVGLIDKTGVFGIDNIDLDFVKDSYSQLFEEALGLNETDLNTAFGLTSRRSKYGRKATPLMNKQLENLESQAIAELYELLPGALFSYTSPQSENNESTLVVTPKISGPATISLYDIQGRMISEVYNGNLEVGAYKEFTVNHSQLNLTTGVYIYEMNSNAGKSSHKFSIK